MSSKDPWGLDSKSRRAATRKQVLAGLELRSGAEVGYYHEGVGVYYRVHEIPQPVRPTSEQVEAFKAKAAKSKPKG